MSFIQAENITKTYGRGDASVTALSGASFSIEEGEFVAMMGESGAGKSTLLSVIGGMNAPTSGTFRVDEIDVYKLSRDRRADFRREFLGFVFQSFHLVPYLSVVENVILPLAVAGGSRKQKRAMGMDALSGVGLADKADRLPDQISGGEQERVAIARAIVNEPPLLLADEPTGNLDSNTTREVMELLQSLNREGMTVVLVTHSHDCARFAGRILRVSDGRMDHPN